MRNAVLAAAFLLGFAALIFVGISLLDRPVVAPEIPGPAIQPERPEDLPEPHVRPLPGPRVEDPATAPPDAGVTTNTERKPLGADPLPRPPAPSPIARDLEPYAEAAAPLVNECFNDFAERYRLHGEVADVTFKIVSDGERTFATGARVDYLPFADPYLDACIKDALEDAVYPSTTDKLERTLTHRFSYDAGAVR